MTINYEPQTNKELNENIQRYGCYLRCLQTIAEMEANEKATTNQINMMYYKYIIEGQIKENCYVQKPEEIINKMAKEIFEIARYAKRTVQIDAEYNLAGIKIKMEKNVYQIDRYEVIGGNEHFVLKNLKNGVIYNPDKKIKLGEVKSVDIYEVEKY